jgi:hypothetical protein
MFTTDTTITGTLPRRKESEATGGVYSPGSVGPDSLRAKALASSMLMA